MAERNQDWQRWVDFFTSRANRPLPAIADQIDRQAVPSSVARSLAIFQLGESGGGSIVEQARTSRIAEIDDAYADAMQLFVREENRHADVLAICVRLLGGELIRENWTAKLFVWSRRLIGLRLKVIVLLAAEVVGICYYHLLASRLRSGAIEAWLTELVRDEKSHLEFHCEFLRSQVTSRSRKWLFVLTWRATMAAAAIAVMIDHRAAIRDVGLEPGTVWRRWWRYAGLAERLVCRRDIPELQLGEAPVE
mgnify:CR=1 FL=1